jgi:predicted transposase YdaD
MLNVVDTARMEGEAMGEVKGEKKALLRIVSNMLSQNFSYEQIQTLTGLSVEVLNAQLEEQTDSEASEPNPQGPPMSN